MGSAVARNRIRRRLRAILASVALPPGDYLFGAAPAARTAPFAALRASVMTVIARCTPESPT